MARESRTNFTFHCPRRRVGHSRAVHTAPPMAASTPRAELRSETPRGLRACLLSSPLLKAPPDPRDRRAGVWARTASVPRPSRKDPCAGISQ